MSSSTANVLIRGVRLYGEGDQVDVLISDGQIAKIGPDLVADLDLVDVIEATGQVLLPGFVDLHTHLREPGREYTETIESGSAAAALGGFTAVFAMANTEPVADSPVVTDHVWNRGRQVGLVDVHPVGAVTVGLEGKQLTEMGMMANGAAQVRMFSDDGKCVDDPLVMRRALEYADRPGRVDRAARRGAAPDRRSRRSRGSQRRAAGAGGLAASRPRSRSSHVTRSWRVTRAPACTSVTPRPRAPWRFSNGPRIKVFRSPPR